MFTEKQTQEEEGGGQYSFLANLIQIFIFKVQYR